MFHGFPCTFLYNLYLFQLILLKFTSILLNVTDGIFHALDKKQLTALVLLDFSKAFDTLDHRLMVAKLKYIGSDNIAVILFSSYFSNRKQKIMINSRSSCVQYNYRCTARQYFGASAIYYLYDRLI